MKNVLVALLLIAFLWIMPAFAWKGDVGFSVGPNLTARSDLYPYGNLSQWNSGFGYEATLFMDWRSDRQWWFFGTGPWLFGLRSGLRYASLVREGTLADTAVTDIRETRHTLELPILARWGRQWGMTAVFLEGGPTIRTLLKANSESASFSQGLTKTNVTEGYSKAGVDFHLGLGIELYSMPPLLSALHFGYQVPITSIYSVHSGYSGHPGRWQMTLELAWGFGSAAPRSNRPVIGTIPVDTVRIEQGEGIQLRCEEDPLCFWYRDSLPTTLVAEGSTRLVIPETSATYYHFAGSGRVAPLRSVLILLMDPLPPDQH